MTGKLTTIVGCCVTLTCLMQAQPICVPPGIQQERLIYNVRPVYPRLAIQAHIQGIVRLAALIDGTGTVERLKLISGHPFLVKAAFDAVKQWLYQPAMYNGVAVAVVTTIEVTFSMGIGEPLPPDKPDASGVWVAAI
jgi:protein TonB